MRTFLLLLVAASALPMRASHICGAEITYALVAGTTYEITVHVYIDPNGPADPPIIVVYTGDGPSELVYADDQMMVSGLCQEQLKTYSFTHTYPGPGTYIVSCTLPGRQAGISNIPGSADATLCASAEINIGMWGDNSSPVFTNYQTELDHTSNALVHDPLVTEADGDSLSFELVVPSGTDCIDVLGYTFPSDLTPPGDLISLDPFTGVFTWLDPNTLGYFVIAIQCTEWRNEMAIGRVTRDMILCVGYLPSGLEELNTAPVLSVTPSLALIGSVEVNMRGANGEVHVLDMSGRLLDRVQLNVGRATVNTDQLVTGMYRVFLPTQGVAVPFQVIHR